MYCPFCSDAIDSPNSHTCQNSPGGTAHEYYANGARKPVIPGFFSADRGGLDTSWLTETPPEGQAVRAAPARPVPPVEPAPTPRPPAEPAVFAERRWINWAGMPGRMSTARWSLGRTVAATLPVTVVLAVLSLVGVAWLFGVITWWAMVPALLGGLGWLSIALVDAARYAMRGGPPPPVL